MQIWVTGLNLFVYSQRLYHYSIQIHLFNLKIYYKTTLADNYKLLLSMLTSPPWQLASENIARLDFFLAKQRKLDCCTDSSARLGIFS